MRDPITCTRDGADIVVRIPDGSSRVLVAVEGVSGIWPLGWVVADGSTQQIQQAVLYRPSEAPEAQMARGFIPKHLLNAEVERRIATGVFGPAAAPSPRPAPPDSPLESGSQ